MTRIRQSFAEHPTATTAAAVVGALVLVALAGLLAINLLGTRDAVADASPSTAPASEAPSSRESIAPSPSQEAPSPSEVPAEEVVYGGPFAVEATADVALLIEPADTMEVGTIPAGAVALIADGPVERDGRDWYLVLHGEDQGWVAADEASFIVHRSVAQAEPAQVLGIDAGPLGFVAWGVDAGSSADPSRPFTAVSSDGLAWQVGPAPDSELGGLIGTTVSGGPNGWIMLRGTPDGSGLGGAWRSDDGLDWQPIEITRTDGGEIADLVPYDLLGHANGYALVVRDDSTGTSRYRVLTSADGLAWRERDIPEGSSDVQLGHLGDGFMAWTVEGEGELVLRYSPDGDQWLTPSGDALDGPLGYATVLAEADGVLVAVSTDVQNGSRRWWSTPVPTADRVATSWTEHPAVADQLAVTAITELIGTEGAAMAFGRAVDDGRHQVWRTADGATWTELDAAALADANADTWVSAGADAGAIIVGYETTDAGPNPVFLHSSDGDAWVSDGGAALGTVESSRPGACPEAPTTMVDWLAIPGAVGAECFGTEPITFTAWNTESGGCGGFSPGFYEPDWLASPFAGTFVLLPFEAPSGGCGGPVLAPDAESSVGLQQWVTLTGHWADPASAECRFRPDPAAPTDPFRPDLAFHCRTVFVISQAVAAGAAP